jgi:hypothetical protein
MNIKSIEVVGSFEGCWTHWIRQILAEAQHAEVHTDLPSWQRFDAFLRMRLGSKVLALVEHPATGLANSLAKGDDVDPEAWLDDWAESARTILTYAQQNPDMTLVVNAEEVRHKPRRLAQLLRSCWGESLRTPSRVVGHDHHPDALSYTLAWSFIERDLAIQNVVSELMASCTVLPGLRAAGARQLEGPSDGVAAVRRLGELLQIEHRLGRLEGDCEAERNALRCELRSAADRCTQLAATVQALEDGRDRILARADAADRELVDARSQIEAEVRERSELAAKLDAAESRQEATAYEMTLTRDEVTALSRQLDEGRAALAQAEAQRDKVEQELVEAAKMRGTLERDLTQAMEHRSALEQELASVQATARAAGEDRALALQHLSQLQAEFERALLSKCGIEKSLHRAEDELAAAARQRGMIAQELASAQAAARIAGEEGKLLLQQLHQLQEELERTVLAKRDAEMALHGAREELAKAETQQGTNEQKLVAAQEAARVAGETHTRCLQQLHQLQQEFQQTVLAKHDTEMALHGVKEELAKVVTQRGVTEQELAKSTKRLSTLEQELAKVTKQQTALEQQLAQATKQQASLELKLTQVTSKKNTLEKDLADAKQGARAAGEEGDLLLRQLHQVQEELERMFLAKCDVENALLAANTGSDGRSKLEKGLRGAREECELLTLQTRQVQQELERVHSEKVRLTQDLKSRIALPGLDDVEIGEVEVVGERDAPPHREVSFVVREVRAGERWTAEAAVRLVEHWGRPGLAIFTVDGRAPLFETWRESGREDGQPYMLLVHGEESAQRVYDSMGTFDWQLVQALAVRLGQALQDHANELSPAWRSLAQRLLTSLQEQPARLRYNNVVVTPLERKPEEEARFELILERVSYHGRTWKRLAIQWQPYGPKRSLDLGHDAESGPPLLAWPADADGAPVRMLRLPLGDDPQAAEVRAVWDALCGSDRAFIAELLTLMPIFAVHLQGASASVDHSTIQLDLQARATDTMLFGRAALQPLRHEGQQVERRRPLLQRMVRRLGIAAKQSLTTTASAAEPALDR